jgi:hypothetical protein
MLMKRTALHMILTILKRIGLIVGVAAVAGCKLYMAGHSADYGLIVNGVGDLDVNTKIMAFRLTYQGTDITCSGNAHERADGVKGMTGGFTCSDGRKAMGKSRLVSMNGGTGYFTDDCGNRIEYAWSTSQAEIQEKANAIRSIAGSHQGSGGDKCHAKQAPVTQSASLAPASPAKALTPTSAVEERLTELKRLHDKGLSDAAEYKAGKKAALSTLNRSANAASTPVIVATAAPAAPMQQAAIPGTVEFGAYHALIIGNNSYQHLPQLKTAGHDAQTIAGLLQQEYGFNITLLLDASRAEIIESLDLMTEVLGGDDNLLIYYAGHGWLDEDANRGYWLAVDAKPNRRTNWVSNATLTESLRTLRAKQVMVMADSCFSGTLTRTARVGLRAGDYWGRMAQKWARVALVSGRPEPVPMAAAPIPRSPRP